MLLLSSECLNLTQRDKTVMKKHPNKQNKTLKREKIV